MLGDALGDADDEGDLSGNGLLDAGGGHRGAGLALSVHRGTGVPGGGLRNKDGCRIGARRLDGLGHVLEDGEAEMFLPGLLGVCATNDLGS